MKLNISKSKNATIYYVSESYRKPNGISTSRNVLRLGTETELREKLGPDADIKEWCKAEIKKLNDAAKAKKPIPIQLTITPDTPYKKKMFSVLLMSDIFSYKNFFMAWALMKLLMILNQDTHSGSILKG